MQASRHTFPLVFSQFEESPGTTEPQTEGGLRHESLTRLFGAADTPESSPTAPIPGNTPQSAFCLFRTPPHLDLLQTVLQTQHPPLKERSPASAQQSVTKHEEMCVASHYGETKSDGTDLRRKTQRGRKEKEVTSTAIACCTMRATCRCTHCSQRSAHSCLSTDSASPCSHCHAVLSPLPSESTRTHGQRPTTSQTHTHTHTRTSLDTTKSESVC